MNKWFKRFDIWGFGYITGTCLPFVGLLFYVGIVLGSGKPITYGHFCLGICGHLMGIATDYYVIRKLLGY